MPDFLEILKNFIHQTSFMGHIFVLALCVPVLYWPIPARWRTSLLLGISVLTLLYNGASFEYLALLALLISMTWSLVIPVPETIKTPLSRFEITLGMACTGLFALTLVLAQSFPIVSVSRLLMGVAVLCVCFTAGYTVYSARMWQYRGWRFTPVLLLAGIGSLLIPNVSTIRARFEPADSLLVLLISCVGLFSVLWAAWSQRTTSAQRRLIAGFSIVLVLMLFLLFKWPTTSPFAWFGFSYIAFRLLHVLLDLRTGTAVPVGTLDEWGSYALFFSAQAVGPIDRWPRFEADMREEKRFSWDDYITGWERILWGAIKKFFIANVLLRFLLPTETAASVIPTVYAWVQIYAYAFYLYCDFSGFVDIAVGTGRLLGYRLPENFDRPYTRGSIALFWQSWHITLSGWLRSYVFLPLSRSLLRTRFRRYPLLTVFIANIVTMSLIGLWHGLTLSFLVWGLWHALGLFVHKVFSDRTRRTQIRWKNTWRAQVFHGVSVFMTFHFVVLGWVFFALPTLDQSIYYLALLFGIRL